MTVVNCRCATIDATGFDWAAGIEAQWADAMFELRDSPHVIDIRTIGLVGGIEMAPRDGAPGARGYDVFTRCFERGLLIRVTGDTIALSPPLIIDAEQIASIVATIAEVLRTVD